MGLGKSLDTAPKLPPRARDAVQQLNRRSSKPIGPAPLTLQIWRARPSSRTFSNASYPTNPSVTYYASAPTPKFPVQRIHQPVEVFERVRNRERRYSSCRWAARHQSRPSPPASAPPPQRTRASPLAPARHACAGKAELQATTASVQPICREVKPLEIAKDDWPAGAEFEGQSKHDDGEDAETSDFTRDLMMTLDQDNLAWLKQQFAKFSDELDVCEFVAVMQSHLPHVAALDFSEKVALVANLQELFDQVDVNGDQRMEWEELTSFIVDQQHSGPMNEAPLPKYKWVEPIQDQTRLRSEQSLERVFYLPSLDCIVLCERPSPVASIYSTKASACLHELRGHKAEVLAVEHIPGGGMPRHLGRGFGALLVGCVGHESLMAASPTRVAPALTASFTMVRRAQMALLGRRRRYDTRMGRD